MRANSVISPKLRNLSYRLHAFFGLHVFAVLALMFLSGTALIFIWEIEATYSRSMQLSEPAASNSASFGQIYDNIQAHDPSLQPVYFTRTGALWRGESTFSRTSNGHEIYVWSHPETAEILGTTDTQSLRKLVHELHVSAMTGHRVGALFVSGFSAVLLFFLISGFITYHQFWKGLFKLPKRRSGARIWWGGVHRLVALWLSPFLLVIALTGFYFFLGTLGLIKTQGPSPAAVSERAESIPEGFNGADLDRAIAVAQAAMPDLEIVLVDLPFSRHHGIVAYGWTDAKLVTHRANQVVVDPQTFEVLGAFRAENLTASQRLTEASLGLHTGVWGGLLSRIFWFALGLLATFLCLAGMMIYGVKSANREDVKARTILGRVWMGMSILKWGLLTYIFLIIALSIYRFAL